MRPHASEQSQLHIDLKHLRYAVAAADHGSFRRAAEALKIEQSTLSRSISNLEHATSMTIFDRSPGGVSVLTSGCDFIRMARGVIEQVDEFSSSNAHLRRGVLSMGFCTSLSAGSLRSNVLDFRRRSPQFALSMLERPRSNLFSKLTHGTLDIIIASGKAQFTECAARSLWGERVLIALPKDHFLADRNVVYWTDLRNETLLMSRHDPYWEFEDLVTAKLIANEDRPKIEHHDVSRSILKSLISMKFGLGLMLESDVGVRVPSVVFKELRDGAGPTRVEFSAFWREANSNPALAQFLQLLKERYPVLS